jgi:hypothetical protein
MKMRSTSIVTAPTLLARNVPNSSGWLGFHRMWSHSCILFKERCHLFLKAGIRSHGPLDSFLVLATCTLHDMKIYLEWIKVRSHVQSRDGARIYWMRIRWKPAGPLSRSSTTSVLLTPLWSRICAYLLSPHASRTIAGRSRSTAGHAVSVAQG